jgi:hypothetical protein
VFLFGFAEGDIDGKMTISCVGKCIVNVVFLIDVEELS